MRVNINESFYPLNYTINYYKTVYTFNATELAWLVGLLQGGNKTYTKLDAYNSDLQSLMQKGLVTSSAVLTRNGIFLATYAMAIYPAINENPLFSITYNYVTNPDSVGVDLKYTESKSEPKYAFQKRLQKFTETQFNRSFKIKSIQEVVSELEEVAMEITKQDPFKDVVDIESSFMSGIAYDDKTEQMDVHLTKGGIYRYQDVPHMVFTALTTAGTRDADYGIALKNGDPMKKMSIGSYYSKMVVGKYKSIRIA